MTKTRDIPFGRPMILDEERAAVHEVLSGPILTHGPQCRYFEEEFGAYLGDGANCVSVSSCMAALHLSYLVLGIGSGDEVIVPAQTHVATVHAVEHTGARPIFCDCEAQTGNIDASMIEALVTPRTKAISVMHYSGVPCDMSTIMAITERHGLKVVEDCAISLGSRSNGKHVGLFGDIGCFSFYPVKHITTAEGGMFVTKHKDLADKVARMRGHGVDRTHSERSIPGTYDVTMLGLNYRMSEMQAALGRVQLGRVDEILKRRRQNDALLREGLAGQRHLRLLGPTACDIQHAPYCLTAVFEGELGSKRNDIVGRLNACGVGTSIYYPGPVPMMTYYRDKYGCAASDYSRAREISGSSVALPVGPHLGQDDMQFIAKTFGHILEEAGR